MALHSDNTSSTEINNSEELSCINILSVDFDWIMAPIINSYNHIVFHDLKQTWEDVYEEIPWINNFAVCDNNKYQDLAVYLSNIVAQLPSPEDYFYGISHEEILLKLDQWLLHTPNKKFRIWNIDHHHDIGYTPLDDDDDGAAQDVWSQKYMTCANWVLGVLNKYHEQFDQYTWIKNINSHNPVPHLTDIFPRYYQTEDIHVIDDVKFDKVFFCLSPGWVPPRLYPLFTALSFSLEKLVNK